jgi:hypothetical protein
VNSTIEQQTRSSFNFARQGLSAVIARHLTPVVTVSGTYQLQRTRVFDERLSKDDPLLPLIDRLFPSSGCRRFPARSSATAATTRSIRRGAGTRAQPGSWRRDASGRRLAS